jgi:DNA replication and repair protein RecF
MIIKRLKLKNYRNYSNLDIQFSDNLNIFIGDNAQGKSNILESIYVLAVTKSYLSVKDKDLIKDGEEYSFLEALIKDSSYCHRLGISISNSSKNVKFDGQDVKKLVDYVSKFRVI